MRLLYYRLQILIEIGKGWFFEKVMKWSRHARKIFRWHYNRLEFAVSSLWKTLGRVVWWLLQLLVFSSILISTCMNICPLALKLNYLRLPAATSAPTYLFNHRISAVARTRNPRARANIKNNLKIHIHLHYTERSWKTWELSLDTLENKAAFEKTTYLQNICR